MQLIEGSFSEEIAMCKEIVDKMVLKYKNKKDNYNACTDLAQTRDGELLDWKDRLVNQRDRIQMLDSQLAILGVNEEHEGIVLYRKFLADIEQVKDNTNSFDKAIQKFSERVADETADLEQMEMKIVKIVQTGGDIQSSRGYRHEHGGVRKGNGKVRHAAEKHRKGDRSIHEQSEIKSTV